MILFGTFFRLEDGKGNSIQAIRNKQGYSYVYDSIGSGGLMINPGCALGWVSRIANELSLIAFTCRPDVDPNHLQFLFQLKGEKNPFCLSKNSLFFLKEVELSKSFSFSETETDLWVKPVLLDNGAVLMEAGRRWFAQGGEILEEKGQFFMTAQGSGSSSYQIQLNPFVIQLKSAQFFSRDLLIQKYGGSEYASWQSKGILQLIHSSSSYACFVLPGDYLLYQKGEWKVVSFDELDENCPIAKIHEVSSQGVKLEIWDEKGFFPVTVEIGGTDASGFQAKQELIPARARLRGATQVSCSLGKRRLVLRQGDWLLKTGVGWKLLRQTEDIERYLYHRLKGELLIVDALEKEFGKMVVKGSLFDETRTQCSSFSIPVEGEKGQGKSSRKKFLIKRGK